MRRVDDDTDDERDRDQRESDQEKTQERDLNKNDQKNTQSKKGVPESTATALDGLDLFEDNAGRPSEPLNQNDPSLSNIPHMASDGCNFRSYQGVAEDDLGKNLTAEEIKDAVDILKKTPDRYNPSRMVIDEEMKVNNPDQVMNDAYDRLGSPDTTATAGWGGNGRSPDYMNQEGITDNDHEHHVLVDGNGNLVNDPYSPDLHLRDTTTTNIWINR